jgi:hypothetical protein
MKQEECAVIRASQVIKETFSNRDKGDKQDNRIQSRSSGSSQFTGSLQARGKYFPLRFILLPQRRHRPQR